MRSSDLRWPLVALCVATAAQAQTRGFALERLVQAAPGTGGFLTDDLRQSGRLDGALGFSLGYARRPLALPGLELVSSEAVAEIAVAVSYDRFRAFAAVASPLSVVGQSGALNGVDLPAPKVTLENHPDSLADSRVGVSVRLLGAPDGPLRLGADGQLFVPTGSQEDYQSDATLRGLVRVLAAGTAGAVDWAGSLGVHLRPFDDPAIPNSPRGTELQLTASAGLKLAVGGRADALRVGPELFGVTATSAAFSATTTGLEALLAARFEGLRADGVHYRLKLGAGGGLLAAFGVPEWRVVGGVELLGGEP